MKNNGLGNPAAAIVATKSVEKLTPAINDTIIEGNKRMGKTHDFMLKNAVPVVVTLAVVAGVYFGSKWYKKYRVKKYARENIDNPDVQAAGIFRKAFVKFEPEGVLSWFLPQINIWTNSNELMKIARSTSSLKNVAKAYSILFDGDLYKDIQNGLDSSDLKEFYATINGTSGNPAIKVRLAKGDKVFSAKKGETLKVYKAEWDSKANKWKQIGELYGNFEFNQEIGKVHASYNYSAESVYYIVERGTIFKDYGLVWDNTIKNRI